jgi:raffinose/stachyose/melibiose transport system substrate-binding protein
LRKTKALRLFSFVLVASMVLITAACGGNKENSGPTSSNSSDEKIKLTLYHQWTDEYQLAPAVNLREVIEQFREENPNVDLTVEVIAPSTYTQKIQTFAASDDLPDIFPALPSMQQTFSKNNLIADLTPIFDKDPEWKNGFVPGAFDDQTFAGKIYGVPYESLISTVLYWNKDIFAKSGIDHFPSNLDEFEDAIKKLQDHGYVPIAMGNKTKDPLASTFMPGLVYRYIDRQWYDSVRENKGAAFTDPEYVKAIDKLGELIKLGAFNKDMNSLEATQAIANYYYTGKAAMFVWGSWWVSDMIAGAPKEILDNTELTTLPAQVSKPELGDLAAGGTGWGYVVNSKVTGAKLDAAIKFLKLMTSKQSGEKMLNAGSISAIKADPTDRSKLPPFFLKFLEFRDNVIPVPVPEIQFSSTYVDASYTGYQDYSTGGITSQKLAEKLQEAMDKSR